jgi:hypothetical protein
LLWGKVYQKITDGEDKQWLLWACEAALLFFKTDLNTKLRNFGRFMPTAQWNAKARFTWIYRLQLGLALLHLVLESSTPEIGQTAQAILAASTVRDPQLTSCVIHDAANAFPSRGPPASKVVASIDEHARLFSQVQLLLALISIW